MMLIIDVIEHAHSQLNVGTSKIGVNRAEFEPNTSIKKTLRKAVTNTHDKPWVFALPGAIVLNRSFSGKKSAGVLHCPWLRKAMVSAALRGAFEALTVYQR
jgi:hypothetical protein